MKKLLVAAIAAAFVAGMAFPAEAQKRGPRGAYASAPPAPATARKGLPTCGTLAAQRGNIGIQRGGIAFKRYLFKTGQCRGR